MQYLIKTESIGGMTEEQFFSFCQENDSIHFERNANGEIVIMEPTGTYSGWYNSSITTELVLWNRKSKKGIVFDSNAGFTLPNKAVRSPDASFILSDRWATVAEEDRERFAHICPDFVIELLSKSDQESALHKKMTEWIENGCRLAWLFDPWKQQTTVYTEGAGITVKPFSEPLNGEDVLPGFVLEPLRIFVAPDR